MYVRCSPQASAKDSCEYPCPLRRARTRSPKSLFTVTGERVEFDGDLVYRL